MRPALLAGSTVQLSEDVTDATEQYSRPGSCSALTIEHDVLQDAVGQAFQIVPICDPNRAAMQVLGRHAIGCTCGSKELKSSPVRQEHSSRLLSNIASSQRRFVWISWHFAESG